MYVDDTSITLAACYLNVFEKEMNNELKNLNFWLAANKITLNNVKTEFMLIFSYQRLRLQNNQKIENEIEGREIIQVGNVISLGVSIDNKLIRKKHVAEISKKISSRICALKRPFVSLDVTKPIYDSLIQPHFDILLLHWG